jgi:hypothetical protein
MSSFIRIALQVGEDANTVDKKLFLQSNKPQQGIQNISQYLAGLAGNTQRGANLKLVADAVRASTFGTFTDEPSAADTVTINGVAFTARASAAVANEFNLVSGGTAPADAAGNATALAASINASVTAKIKNIIKASAALGVVTLTCLVPGAIGNLCTLAESMDNFTVDNATFENGTEDTDVELAVGLPAETSA